MAERRGAGLTFGQLVTLTFGFLLASLFIFVFGFWVGYDLADQRALRQRPPMRVPMAAAPTAASDAPPAQVAALAPTPMPTRVAVVATATVIRVAPTATAAQVVRATATPQPVAVKSPTPGAGNYTVQAYATNDTMRAIMLARTLRAKGYDASTGEKKVGAVTWYTVKVGRFRDRAAAKALENKLRDVEGLEAASVVAQ